MNQQTRSHVRTGEERERQFVLVFERSLGNNAVRLLLPYFEPI